MPTRRRLPLTGRWPLAAAALLATIALPVHARIRRVPGPGAGVGGGSGRRRWHDLPGRVSRHDLQAPPLAFGADLLDSQPRRGEQPLQLVAGGRLGAAEGHQHLTDLIHHTSLFVQGAGTRALAMFTHPAAG